MAGAIVQESAFESAAGVNAPWQTSLTGVTAGNVLHVIAMWPNNTGSNLRTTQLCYDNKGNGTGGYYIRLGQADDPSGAGSGSCCHWYAPATTGGSITVSIDKPGGGDFDDYIGVILREISGVSSAVPIGHNEILISSAAATADSIAATASIANVPAFISAASVNMTLINGRVPSAGTGFTTGLTSWGWGMGATVRVEQRSISGTTTATATFTPTASGDNFPTVMAVWQEAGSVATPPTPDHRYSRPRRRRGSGLAWDLDTRDWW